jgi:transglutaminase-like putative cysteine protease
LLCAMLRHKGIPARIHVGFADYFRVFGKGFHTGHVVTEYWDAAAARWKLVDPEQSSKHIQFNQIDFDVHDVPSERFWVAGKAWQMCREGQADAETFGAAPDDFFRGWWALRHRIFHELAYLNKTELLLWDSWSWMEYDFQPDPRELAVLDEAAALTLRDDLNEIRTFFADDERFRVSTEVMSYSPTGNFVKVKP